MLSTTTKLINLMMLLLIGCVSYRRPLAEAHVPHPDCGENEFYSWCMTRCGESCDHVLGMLDCPPTTHCEDGCRCHWGMYRDAGGRCVETEGCSPPDYGNYY